MNPFPTWLDEVASEPLVVNTDCIEAEAHRNMWSFSLSREQAASVSIADVEEFARGVIEARRASLSATGMRPMVMYWCHDAMAGHLCFSLVSASHGILPFGCELEPANEL